MLVKLKAYDVKRDSRVLDIDFYVMFEDLGFHLWVIVNYLGVESREMIWSDFCFR